MAPSGTALRKIVGGSMEVRDNVDRHPRMVPVRPSSDRADR